ncbi:MAG TPA: polysaccharide biosynthesis tyrosine autokinase [Longimicrobiales bacterium]|nr:polysaccharide biosynthesis tyrosine autokinase [Longimicrobiales bacterium]
MATDLNNTPVLPSSSNNNGGGGTGANPELRYYLHVLRRRWWLIALVTVAVVAGAAWRASRQVPKYAAEAEVVRQASYSPMDGGLGAYMELQPEAMAVQLNIISSPSVLRQPVQALGLRLQTQEPTVHRSRLMRDVHVDVAAAPANYVLSANGAHVIVRNAAGRVVAQGDRGDLIQGPGFSFVINADLPLNQPVRFAIISESHAIDAIKGGLRTEQMKSGPVMLIRYTGTDPILTAAITNGVAEGYQFYSGDRARKEARDRKNILADRLQQIRDSLRVAEQSVESANSGEAVTGTSALLTQQVVAAQDEQRRLRFNESMLMEVKRSIDAGSTDAVQRAIAGGDFAGFRESYNRIQDLEAEKSRLISSGASTRSKSTMAIDSQIVNQRGEMRRIADANLKVTHERQTETEQRVRDLQSQYGNASSRAVVVDAMKQALESLQRHHDLIAEKYYEAQIAEQLDKGTVEITDPAEVPTTPTGSGTMHTLFLALLIGLALGVVAASVLEQIDTRVRDPEDANRATAVGVIGMIPELKANESNRPLALGADEHTLAAEAYRKLRTNLRFVRADRPRAIAVTSPSPAEGKSVTASNLALAMAQQGQSVLVIDADLRRPVQHKVFGVGRGPGLSDVVVGLVEPLAAIQSYAEMPNLYIMTCGTEAPNPAELLGSEAFQRLVTSLLDKFDTVVIDTPPVMLVTDAAVIGSICDGVIIVAEAGRTERGVLSAAVNELRHARGSVIGIVLNRVGVGRASGRYTKYAYYSSKSYYAEDKPGTTSKGNKNGERLTGLRDWISALI